MNIAFSNQQERIVSLIRQGETAASDFQVGMEIEHIIVDAETLRSIDYYETGGIEEILKAMLPLGYEAILENERLIGLLHPDYVITLEPGGQLEISIKPCRQLSEIYTIYWTFLDRILPVLHENRQWMLCIGYHPQSSIQEIPFNPKQRYRHMSEYLGKTGRYAHYMMKGTASLQVVIDYQHQADFIEKFRVAHFLMPFLALISDNAPFFEGKPAEHFSIRTAIWDETDPARCALIPGVMDQEFGYRAYADYILRTPPILVQKNNHFIGTGSLRTEELEGLEHFTDEEVDHLLSMVFPDVRVRRYIEIRMADSLPLPHSFAFAALVKNLFYSETALRYLYHLSQSMNDANLCQLRKDMQVNGYNARFGGTTCQQMLLALMDLAKQNSTPQEKKWLYHLEAQVLNKETPAMVSRRLVDAAGMNALEWCAAHTWKKEAI
ncbi:MAG: glutamate-cysteine ligase family protein [Bacillota bacterium]|nr:glutamate-cysteine ligase family protein [Bacillota bacterium]MDW7676633.1 glutamate-cysteine ligase family protein [Bacillota bacterium]